MSSATPTKQPILESQPVLSSKRCLNCPSDLSQAPASADPKS